MEVTGKFLIQLHYAIVPFGVACPLPSVCMVPLALMLRKIQYLNQLGCATGSYVLICFQNCHSLPLLINSKL